jgi:hypothetical protein
MDEKTTPVIELDLDPERIAAIETLFDVCAENPAFACLRGELRRKIVFDIEASCHQKTVEYCDLNHIVVSYSRTINNNNVAKRYSQYAVPSNFAILYSTEIYKQAANLRHAMEPARGGSMTSHGTAAEPSRDTTAKSYLDRIIADPSIASRAAYLSSQDIDPEASAAERERIRARSAEKVVKKYASKVRCKYCGSNKVQYFKSKGSTLGLDEISTFKFKCDEDNGGCGAEWSS